MEVLETVRRKFGSFIKNNSKLTLTIIFTLITLVTAALIIILYETASLPEALKKSDVNTKHEFVQTDSFLTPPPEKITEDYYYSREERDSWTEEEVNENFTVPDSQWIDSLKEANRQKVNKILGAAP
ncbi:hypothetical protein [Treponema sp.]|uniref:hypothetical protein n=1 Tax=Treponema sp. TaxID=166 RepID=UPI0025F85B8E|nr:hypothetical protein [Treponema sp.]MCR5218304.1 hypothetical protein [Treponema sp.]